MSKEIADKSALVPELGAPTSPAKSSVKPVGFVIVGLGRAGHFHMTSITHLAGLASLKYVVDTDESRFSEAEQQFPGCKGTTKLEEALSDPAVDAVVISSTTNTHYSYCKAALTAGKAVFTEKPISHNPAELREIIELAISKARANENLRCKRC